MVWRLSSLLEESESSKRRKEEEIKDEKEKEKKDTCVYDEYKEIEEVTDDMLSDDESEDYRRYCKYSIMTERCLVTIKTPPFLGSEQFFGLERSRGYVAKFLTNHRIMRGVLGPQDHHAKFAKLQEFDLRCAIPLGFYRAALNIGMAAGVVLPWGNAFQNMQTPVPERFFLGGNLSPIGTLGGTTALWGFRSRGLGPTEPRRQVPKDTSEGDADPGRDFLGGDLAVTAFADLSFDFPLEWLRAKGIHAHIFASAGNVEKLTENAYRNFSLRSFAESSRSSIGCGVVVPTQNFRMEMNYCYLLKKSDHDRGKSGFGISFSI